MVRAGLVAALLLAPGALLAHGERPSPSHGGEVQDAKGVLVELTVKGSEVEVFVSREDHQPLPAQLVSGTATVLVGGRSYKVELAPAGTNVLKATLPVAATGKPVGAVFLNVEGRPVSARFTGSS